MAIRDFVEAETQPSLDPQAHTATGNGAQVDISDSLGALMSVVTGDYTDGTFNIEFQHSDDGTNWTGVPSGEMNGTTSVTISASGDANSAYNARYTGNNKFLRISITNTSSVTTGCEIAGTVVKRLQRVSED